MNQVYRCQIAASGSAQLVTRCISSSSVSNRVEHCGCILNPHTVHLTVLLQSNRTVTVQTLSQQVNDGSSRSVCCRQPLSSLLAAQPDFLSTQNLENHRSTAEPAPVDTSPQNDEVDAANALLLLLPTAEKQASIAVPAPAAPPDENPGTTFYPGLIVWAKVEGHSFWPAQVVRRRAVPRTEVGPPPGGPANVMNCFPVVFMNQNGIPAEICDTMESRIGSSRAGRPANEDQEAEYAWVVANCMRPFQPGNYEPVQDLLHTNVELATCVRAAEEAVRARAADGDEPLYDSDGGWGSAQPSGSDAGQQGTRRARTNRSRGARRVRNRRAAGSADDGDSGAYAFHGPQIVVDSILGWQYAAPPTDQVSAVSPAPSSPGHYATILPPPLS